MQKTLLTILCIALLAYLQYTIITYYGITYLHITLHVLKDLRCTVITHLQEKRKKKLAVKLLTDRHALTSEKEFPLMLKFLFTIQRGSNVFFISLLSYTVCDEVAENEYSII